MCSSDLGEAGETTAKQTRYPGEDDAENPREETVHELARATHQPGKRCRQRPAAARRVGNRPRPDDADHQAGGDRRAGRR